MKFIKRWLSNQRELTALRTLGLIERELFWKLFSDIGVDQFQKILDEKKKEGVQYVNLAEMYIKHFRK